MKNILKKLSAFIIFFCLFFTVGCNNKEYGRFYSIKEAYESELIDKNDLLNIAYYYNGNKNINDVDFDIIPIDESLLTDDIEKKIKKDHLKRIEDDVIDSSIDGVYLLDYLGTYNDCHIIKVRDKYRKIDIYYEPLYIIDGVEFENFGFPGIEIWIEI